MEISIQGRGLLCTFEKLLPAQLRRVMKLTTVLLTVACIHVSAGSFEQTVSFKGQNVPLTMVLSSIEKQTGLSFFYNYALLKDAKPVTLFVENVTLKEMLREILNNRGFDYYQTAKTIFIVRKQSNVGIDKASNTGIPSYQPQRINVNGRIINQQGDALAGASVSIKNGRKGVVTDQKGEFELKNVPSDAVLEITYTGYTKKEVFLNGKESVIVEMTMAQNTLDETEVIAYGQTTERFNTGNVTTVKAEDLAKQPVDNPLLALEGRVPGLVVSQANGLAGTGVTVRIEGQNSLRNGNDPLYVVDGVPYSSEMISTIANGLLGQSGAPANGEEYGAGNPLTYINPTDIESISVLRDADATAIYGSRAANGAILITTKKGRLGQPKFDINIQQGVGKVAHFMDLMNTQQYLAMRHEALKNDGVTTPALTDYDINGFWDTTRYTNWQKKLIGRPSQYSNFNGGISGGGGNTQYLIGATYHKETTVFPGNFNDQKGALHFNLASSSANQKFHVALLANYLVDHNQLPMADLTNASVMLSPDAPTLYNADGSLNWMLTSAGASSWTNPLSTNYSIYTSDVNNLISNAVLRYEIIPGMELKSSFGYSNMQQNEVATSPLVSFAPESQPYVLRSATYSISNTNSWIIEPQLSYKRTINKGRIDILVGSTIEQRNAINQAINGSGYNSDDVLKNMGSASVLSGTSTVYDYKYSALFARINYNWNDKYILDLTARRDGSSRFGPANEFHNFGAAGLGWIFSKEKLIENHLKWLSFGKLKISYGTTGNDQIGNYKFLSLYNPVNQGVNYQGTTGLLPTGLSNPYLQWEETNKLSFGLSLGFLRDNVLLNGDYYINRSSNQLLSYPLPINTGFNSIGENLPATTENYGFELSVATINLKSKKFSWFSSFNLTIPGNKLVSFNNLAKLSSYNSLYVLGKPFTGIIPLYRYAGVNQATGEYQFYDHKGNITYTPSFPTDATDTVYLSPKPYGGLENQIDFMGFQLDFLFQFVKQYAQNNYIGFVEPGYFRRGEYNQPTYILNHWKSQGDLSSHQLYSTGINAYNEAVYTLSSNISYSDASYIRLKNASLSWQVPKAWLYKAHFQSARLFVLGQNLLTFTKYKGGLDPENLSTTSLPPLRVITGGVQLTF